MGYFDGLASGIIKKDKNNNAVYYPWGVLGKGYVLPDAVRETTIKNMVILLYQLFFGLFFVHLFLLKNIPIFAVLTIVLIAWFLFKSHQLTKDCPKSDEKLTLKEGYINSAKAHNKTVLWILLVVAVLFTIGGIAMLVSGKLFLPGLIMTLLFGASSAAIYYMIQVKNKQTD
jgi:Ca2+/Na+ antiporter